MAEFNISSPIPTGGESEALASALKGGGEMAAGVVQQIETQLSSITDVQAARQFFTPAGAEQMGMAPSLQLNGLEAGALNNVGNAAVAAAGADPVQTMIQLVMRLPGAAGLAQSFFDFLAALFQPGPNGIFNLDFMHVGANVTNLTGLAAEHLPVSLSLLPSDASIFQNLGSQLGKSLTDLRLMNSSMLPGSLAVKPELLSTSGDMNVGSTLDLRKAQFESGADSLTSQFSGNANGSTGQNGVLADTELSADFQGGHLAGNERLFSDKLGSSQAGLSTTASTGSQATAGGSLPVTSGSLPVNGIAGNNMASGSELLGSSMQPGSLNNQFAGNSKPIFEAPAGIQNNNTGELASVPESGVAEKLAAGSDLSQYDSFKSSNIAAESSTMHSMQAKALSLEQFNKMKLHGSSASHGVASSGQVGGSSSTGNSHIQAGQSVPKTAVAKPVLDKNLSLEKNGAAATSDSLAPGKTGVADSSAATDSSAAVESQEIAAAEDVYAVQSGDNLWNIAKDKLGDGTRWNEIYALNKDVLGSKPELIHTGDQLKMPSVAKADNPVYTVKSGDNLWDIAHEHLGDGNRWTEIYEANRNMIGDNPSLIHSGLELRLPGMQDAQMASAAAPSANLVQNASLPAAPQVPIQPAPVAAAPQFYGGQEQAQMIQELGQPDYGPGAAAAATLNQGSGPINAVANNNNVVSFSLLPDLSFLDNKATQ